MSFVNVDVVENLTIQTTATQAKTLPTANCFILTKITSQSL